MICSTAIISVGLDQYSKYLATQHLEARLGGYSFFNGFFRLIYAENEGAFLSLGSETTGWLKYIGLYAFPVILLIGLLWYLLNAKSLTKTQIIALSLVLAGGISNIYDRLLFGKVVDFMIMGFQQLKTGVFNIADVSIMTGLFLLIFSTKKKTTPTENTTEENSEATEAAQ
ncbi:MAG: signal peptidase II [Flavobacteriaceae bacterium]|nr:signal peptidase II [Flavobacteriaceae bacterium]